MKHGTATVGVWLAVVVAGCGDDAQSGDVVVATDVTPDVTAAATEVAPDVTIEETEVTPDVTVEETEDIAPEIEVCDGPCCERADGFMACEGTGFTTCEGGAAVYRDCGVGTSCVASGEGQIVCDFPAPTCGGVFAEDTWYTELAAFEAAAGTTRRLDFETRGDGVTPVTAGVDVPPDEYLACCGVRVTGVGDDPLLRVIWAGNVVTGFSVRAICGNGPCEVAAGVRLTLEPHATALAVQYAGSLSATYFDVAGDVIDTRRIEGFGSNFAGFTASVPIAAVELVDGGGEDVQDLRWGTCE